MIVEVRVVIKYRVSWLQSPTKSEKLGDSETHVDLYWYSEDPVFYGHEHRSTIHGGGVGSGGHRLATEIVEVPVRRSRAEETNVVG